MDIKHINVLAAMCERRKLSQPVNTITMAKANGIPLRIPARVPATYPNAAFHMNGPAVDIRLFVPCATIGVENIGALYTQAIKENSETLHAF